ncbi:M48 family metallopeptidase [Corynebacterium pilosum]|uniref:Putative metal-dependent hydrolase n=1 Tax=Corynebacterium pilosum TaxID=35756 RepID=A0A376CP56_9CORY|nr:SprT-like domain-containing protein [Corynebacterium pilosum]STC69879.1 putative metal-dependent hydrolase [Corynebacterium pilosum]
MSKVKVIRSAKRRRTIQARDKGDHIEVRIPATFTKRQEEDAVAEMVAKLAAKNRSRHTSDADLQARAEKLNDEILGGRARVGSIRWVSNQNTRWGSCTVATGDIRISDRLKEAPDYVVDSVIVHELTHTFIPGHGPDFWQWADKTPLAERAKGFLEAFGRFR